MPREAEPVQGFPGEHVIVFLFVSFNYQSKRKARIIHRERCNLLKIQ